MLLSGFEATQNALSYKAGGPSLPVLEHTIGHALRMATQSWPDKPALIEGTSLPADRRRWTFSELLQQSEIAARALLRVFAPGEHVAVWSSNKPEWVFIEFGAALAGLTLVTVNPAFLEHELAFVLRQSKASGLFVEDEFRGRDLRSIAAGVRATVPTLKSIICLSDWDDFVAKGDDTVDLPVIRPHDVAQIQYTSGTTGAPKGARLTHRSLVNNGRIYACTIGAGADDIWVNPMPLFHTAGCGLCTLGALQTGGAQVLPAAFDPSLMLDLFAQERGTVMLCVPTMLIRMLEEQAAASRDLSSWRLVTMGGAPVPPELVREAQAIGVKVAIGFGQTEASPYLTHTLPDDPHPDWANTVGPPMPQTEIKIVDPETGETVPINQIGEICARGYSIMKDYFDNPDATRDAIDQDGWLHTGDLGSLDADGYCRILGRRKDMVIRGGENIYPREIEDVLHEHPAVSAVSVIGVPDADWGEVLVAFVQVKPGMTLNEKACMDFCRTRLAPFKVPRLWRFVDHFPQTASGKIQKFVLRDRYLSALSQ